MMTRILPAVVIGAAVLAFAPASAADISSLSAFLHSCSDDAKACHIVLADAVRSARSAKYGCIPATLSADDAADQLLHWMKATASADAKYEKEPFADLLWTGVDEVWPCKK